MNFVAVTACPTGIAHSQMAAENLEQTAERLGHEIKVEVQGAMGAENELTAEDIAAADAVIIAADTSVQRDRFENVPVVKGTVKDGVNDAEGLIQRAVDAAGGESATDEDAADAEATGADPTDADATDADATGATAEESRSGEDGSARADRDDADSGDDAARGGLLTKLKRMLS